MLSVYLKLCEKNRYLPNFILNEKKIFMIKTAFPLREEKKTYSSTKELKINIGFLCTVFCSVRWDSFLYVPTTTRCMMRLCNLYIMYCNGVRCIYKLLFSKISQAYQFGSVLYFLVWPFAFLSCFMFQL